MKTGNRGGFTLIEVLLASGVMAMVMASAMAAYISCYHLWFKTSAEMDASNEAGFIVLKMVHGVGEWSGLRSASASTVSLSTGTDGWSLQFTTPDGTVNSFIYSASTQTISLANSVISGGTALVGDDVTSAVVTNTGSGATIAVQTTKQRGGFVSTGNMSTYVAYRN